MKKTKLNLIALTVFLSLIFCSQSLSQGEESVTITTYYPAPYGVYNEVEVYRSITYTKVNKANISDPNEGELIYNVDGKFWYYTGSAWVALG